MKQKFRVIIPAAGKATRMRPLSNSISKAMVPINGKPIISYIIDQLFKIGEPSEIIIVHNELKDIENFVKNFYPQYKNKIFFIQQYNPEGPLHAIQVGGKKLIEIIGKENKDELPIMIWLGDTICLESSFDMKKSFLVTSPVNDYQRWCLVDKNCRFYDKPDIPPRTNKALIGIYYFKNANIFWKSLDEGMKMGKIKNEYQISNLLNCYLKNGQFFELENTDKWYDCGELHTFYQSKARLLNKTTRSFNEIIVDTFLGTITKKGKTEEGKQKIELEKQWYKKLPQKLNLFVPKILDSEYGTLIMSQEPGVPLNEMWLYDNLRYDVWISILEKILKIHNEVFLDKLNIKTNKENQKLALQEMYITKNLKRIDDIQKKYPDFPEFETVRNFIKKTGEELINSGVVWSTYIHGDSHLGNILFEPLQGNIKFVDPRGKFGNIEGTEGDMRYDMGKLTQDFYLNYAEILANNYRIENNKVIFYKNNDLSNQICRYLKTKFSEYGYNWEQIFKLAIVLIITAIPFHSDDLKRQRAFWLIGLEKIKSII